jgi:hypothetical protein
MLAFRKERQRVMLRISEMETPGAQEQDSVGDLVITERD